MKNYKFNFPKKAEKPKNSIPKRPQSPCCLTDMFQFHIVNKEEMTITYWWECTGCSGIRKKYDIQIIKIH